MITINLKEGILAAAAMLEAGKLQAQVNPRASSCAYRDATTGAPCFVGAMISDDEFNNNLAVGTADGGTSLNFVGVDYLMEKGKLTVSREGLVGTESEVKAAITHLQSEHDGCVGNFTTEVAREDALRILKASVAKAVEAVNAGKVPVFE